MSKKIIVAGGGHGGIATAAILARAGFDVTVFEKNQKQIWDTTGRTPLTSIRSKLPSCRFLTKRAIQEAQI